MYELPPSIRSQVETSERGNEVSPVVLEVESWETTTEDETEEDEEDIRRREIEELTEEFREKATLQENSSTTKYSM